jgi:hypothetical protein
MSIFLNAWRITVNYFSHDSHTQNSRAFLDTDRDLGGEYFLKVNTEKIKEILPVLHTGVLL